VGDVVVDQPERDITRVIVHGFAAAAALMMLFPGQTPERPGRPREPKSPVAPPGSMLTGLRALWD